MSIRKWQAGKLVLLWAWGGLLAALSLTSFLSEPVRTSPWLHLIELATCMIILISLSVLTWHWLGRKES